VRWALPALALFLAGCGSTPGTIAFTSTRDGNAEVYVMRADGSHVVDLTRNLAQDGQPSWSPDGKRIAFVSTRTGNAQIYVMNADGSTQRRVTHSQGGDTAPAWSPDGTRIAFMCTFPTPRLVTEICVVGADGTGERELTSPKQGDNLYPVWTSDSKAVLFTRPRGVGLVDLAGHGAQGPPVIGNVAELVYAPDGITFAYLEHSSTWTLHVGSRRVSTVAGNVDSPAWSPDGSRLVFVARVARSDLYVVDADGGNQHALTSGPGNSLSPRWSPDGKSIAFERLRGQSSQVYVVRADGTGETQLTREGKNGGPVWKP
jgi:Tol biopolymer transport system component